MDAARVRVRVTVRVRARVRLKSTQVAGFISRVLVTVPDSVALCAWM